MAMTFGIHIGHMGGPLDEMRKLWRFADAKGFDWFSVSDHFQESPPRGGDFDCFEGLTMLTAAALETRHVRLGALVYCVAYRNPGQHAKALTTIDHLSGGRVDCGRGAGWHEIEAKAFGYEWPRIGVREDMLEEYAQVMRQLFDRETRRANFQGRHFRVEKDWKRKSDVLTQWCETERRDPKTILRTVNLGFYLGADAKGAARGEEILRSHWGKRADETGWLRGTPKDAKELVAAFRDAGCARVNLAFREGPYDWDALDAFADEVMPAFGAKRPG